MILSEVSAPIQHSVIHPETPSEGDVLQEESTFSPPVFDVTSDDYSISDGDVHVTENSEPSHQSRAERVTPADTPVTAGTSQRGRVRTLSRRMAKSIAQGLHHVARESPVLKQKVHPPHRED